MSLADRFYADPFADVDVALGAAQALRDRRSAGRLFAVRAGIAGRTGSDPSADLRSAAENILAMGGDFSTRDATLVAIALIGAPGRAGEILDRLSSGFRSPSSSAAPGKARRARMIYNVACLLARRDADMVTSRSKSNPITAIAAGDAETVRAAVARDARRVARLRSRSDKTPEKHLPVDGLLLAVAARARPERA